LWGRISCGKVPEHRRLTIRDQMMKITHGKEREDEQGGRRQADYQKKIRR
jgi:hypothetical protein